MTRPLIDPDIAPYAQAVEFVFAREDECIRTDGACGDDEFYAAFDVLPRNVAVLVDGYQRQADGSDKLILSGQASQWMTPNVPNGGRVMPASLVASKGTTPEGAKRTVGLESQVMHWTTPDAAMHAGGNTSPGPAGFRPNITLAAQEWPTPTAMDSESAGGRACIEAGNRGNTLSNFSQAWPTPSARDHKSERGGG